MLLAGIYDVDPGYWLTDNISGAILRGDDHFSGAASECRPLMLATTQHKIRATPILPAPEPHPKYTVPLKMSRSCIVLISG
jgi:hypothetical protein